jgi:hypothetical protein
MKVLSSAADSATVELTNDDVRMLNNALNEVLHGPDSIDEWEFSLRMGVERSEALDLLAEFRPLKG